jgi:hypothetical protein
LRAGFRYPQLFQSAAQPGSKRRNRTSPKRTRLSDAGSLFSKIRKKYRTTRPPPALLSIKQMEAAFVRKKKEDFGKSERLNWHLAFYQAMQMELFEYLDDLEFTFEYQLISEPMTLANVRHPCRSSGHALHVVADRCACY